MAIYLLRLLDDTSYRFAANVSVPRTDTEVTPFVFNRVSNELQVLSYVKVQHVYFPLRNARHNRVLILRFKRFQPQDNNSFRSYCSLEDFRPALDELLPGDRE